MTNNTKQQSTVVRAKNAQGQVREFNIRTWDLMRNAKDGDGQTRKGWTRIDDVRVGATTTVRPILPSKQGKSVAVPFVPPEVEEANRKAHSAEQERLAAMISGESQPAKAAPAEAQPTEATPASGPGATAKEAGALPATEEQPKEAAAASAKPPAEEQADDFSVFTGMGAKVADALRAKGVLTYAQLASAATGDINTILDGIGMAPKKAQVPMWKVKAKEMSAKTAKQ